MTSICEFGKFEERIEGVETLHVEFDHDKTSFRGSKPYDIAMADLCHFSLGICVNDRFRRLRGCFIGLFFSIQEPRSWTE